MVQHFYNSLKVLHCRERELLKHLWNNLTPLLLLHALWAVCPISWCIFNYKLLHHAASSRHVWSQNWLPVKKGRVRVHVQLLHQIVASLLAVDFTFLKPLDCRNEIEIPQPQGWLFIEMCCCNSMIGPAWRGSNSSHTLIKAEISKELSRIAYIT